MARKPGDLKVETEIARLPDLGLGDLRTRWHQLYGRPAPKFLRRKFLVRAIAYQIQVEAYGGLSAATKRRLREIAEAVRDGTFDAKETIGPRIKPGTKLIRSYRGETHPVLVVEGGFEWKEARYSSLSTIAKQITGTSWNGWTFFGVKGAASRKDRNGFGRFKRPPAGPDGKPAWPRRRSTRSDPMSGDEPYA